MQLTRSLLALCLLVAYFLASAVVIYSIAAVLAVKLFLGALYCVLLFLTLQSWLSSSAEIMSQGDKIVISLRGKKYTLAQVKYHLDCCVCCSVAGSRKAITLWRDQFAAGDYRRLRGLLLALK